MFVRWYFSLLFGLNNVRLALQATDPPVLETVGNLVAVNNDLLVLADNEHAQLTIIEYTKPRASSLCKILYGYFHRTDPFIRLQQVNRVILNSEPVNNKSVAVLLGTQVGGRPILMMLTLVAGVCNQRLDMISKSLEWWAKKAVLSIAVDPLGENFCLIFDNKTIFFRAPSTYPIEHSNEVLWSDSKAIDRYSLIFTADRRVFVVAYQSDELDMVSRTYLHVLNVSDLQQPMRIGAIPLPIENIPRIESSWDQHGPPISVSVHEDSQTMIIGRPNIDTVCIISYQNPIPKLIYTHASSKKNTGFGYSVAMLDATSYAVLVRSLPTSHWSLSQVQVYSFAESQLEPKLMFIFPNNQQNWNTPQAPAALHRFSNLLLGNSGAMFVVQDDSPALIIQNNPAGFFSQVDGFYPDTDIFQTQSKICPIGTYRNSSSWGPCFICPPNMKSVLGLMCEPCVTKQMSRCFLAAIEEIELGDLTSHTQAYRYPESSGSTEYDDLLFSNMFQLSINNVRCLLLSPVFWAIISCLVCMILVQSVFYWVKRKMTPKSLFNFFSRENLFNSEHIHGRIFLGTCFSIFMIFLGLFSFTFARRYPIERVTVGFWGRVVCDSTLVNSKFSSSLQLLSELQTEEEKSIFDILDQQNFTLTVQFIGTGFLCTDFSVKQNQDHGLSVLLTDYLCSVNNTVVNVSIPLSQHLLTLQMHLVGPYFIGAIRFCFNGASFTSNNGKYTLQHLDHCELHWKPNQTWSRNPKIRVKLTKVINQTRGMTANDGVTYSGRWLPALTITTMTDALLLERNGEFFRYLSSEVDVSLEITESEFYIQNIQEPISRGYEIIFKTILFSSKSYLKIRAT